MDAKTQIIILLYSYIFGFIFYYLSKINNKIITNKSPIYRSITTILFMLNIVLIYLIILYKLNNGKFHLYFFIMLVLGFYSSYSLNKHLLSNVKLKHFLAKIKK